MGAPKAGGAAWHAPAQRASTTVFTLQGNPSVTPPPPLPPPVVPPHPPDPPVEVPGPPPEDVPPPLPPLPLSRDGVSLLAEQAMLESAATTHPIGARKRWFCENRTRMGSPPALDRVSQFRNRTSVRLPAQFIVARRALSS
jgi:hypothetical protein